MMMSWPYIVGRQTSVAASPTASSRSDRVSSRPASCCRLASTRMQFSTITIAPSTMMPKSRAPRLNRFPLTPRSTIPVIANSIESGIAHAVMMAARTLPRNRKRIAMTSSAPSSRLCCTVSIVASTSVVRSYTVFATTPAGSVRLTSSMRAATRRETVRLFSPISMKTVPSTTSRPSSVAAPVLSSLPRRTSATSCRWIGVPW